jgi:hypothetical protein
MHVVRRPKLIDDLARAYEWVAVNDFAAAERLLGFVGAAVARLRDFHILVRRAKNWVRGCGQSGSGRFRTCCFKASMVRPSL